MPTEQLEKITLSIAERKHRLPFGAQIEVARQAGVSRSLVSAVVNDTYRPITEQGLRTMRRIRVRIARKLGMRVDDVFPPPAAPVAIGVSEAVA